MSVLKLNVVKMYGIVAVWLHTLLTSTLYADEWSAPNSSHFIPGVTVPQYPESRKFVQKKT
jgi:hypothetical protein